MTVPDLTLRARACYDEGQSEAALLDDLCKVDLLVLDEVGIQRDSRGEKVLLNQIIDRRLAAMRPVGVLTNLNYDALVMEFLAYGLILAPAYTAFRIWHGDYVQVDYGEILINVVVCVAVWRAGGNIARITGESTT